MIDINQIDVIFFAIIIITSVYDRFAKGALRVLISLLLISYKYSIWSLVSVSRGGALSHFFRLHRGVFVWVARAHRGAVAASPRPRPLKKEVKKGQMFKEDGHA